MQSETNTQTKDVERIKFLKMKQDRIIDEIAKLNLEKESLQRYFEVLSLQIAELSK